ncbi:MAG: ATP-dependent Clp protease proteolytic subunit [Flavobacteriales bacterium]|jgi:ATP-dependent protease ClpP protease subunit|nr:ATP-dependent Clp protease proteolytic subunit [Flavobacteriales bacterium]
MKRITINNIIGKVGEKSGIFLTDVISQYEALGRPKELEIFIQTFGGSTRVGDSICKYFEDLKEQGVKINTVAGEYVASMGVKIFLLGENRDATKCSFFMIHNPWAKPKGDADFLRLFADKLKEEEYEIAEHYASRTGASVESMKALMKIESELTPIQVYQLGFSTIKPQEADLEQVVAFLDLNKNQSKTNNHKQMTKEEFEAKTDSFLARVLNVFKSNGEIHNLIVQDANGKEIDFTELNDGDTPKVGDKATIDGKSASGEYVMPSGDTYSFENGALSKITPKEADTDSEEVANLKAKIAEKESEIETLKNSKETEINNLKETHKEAMNTLKTEVETQFNEFKSTFNFVETKPNQKPNTKKRFGSKIKPE